MADDDADMPDVASNKDGQQVSSQVVQSIEKEPDVKKEDTAEDGADVEDDEMQDGDGDGDARPVSNDQYKALKAITEVLSDHKIKKGNEDYYPSLLFKRVPNKRNLPDYYQIISEPSAISTLKGKIQRKNYTGIPEFVRDFALIVHNAQVYNRPNSQPVRDVFVLQDVFRDEMKKLVEQGLAKEEDVEFPDLGEIPAATPEPDPVSEDEEEDGDEDGEEDEDDEEGDESDEGRKKRRRGRASISGRKGKGDDEDDDGRKRRGRPPKVDTPMEARIKLVIKGLRKPKDNKGNFRIRHFERLPDKAEHPHYYQEIKEPIALDTIKKKAKRKKYSSLENFMKDLELMFKNAMLYNVDGSEIYKDAKTLLQEAQALMEAEKQKPDTDFMLDDGRVPLPEGIEYKDEKWKIGDWVHIQNPNDVTKPIVAQIYRTWRDSEGQNWINACWYYRPEQTIHQHEKHFYPNEVCKTGQYRDHHIEEVMDRCFVMFFTRYSRGRPRGLDASKEVYVCESRYNEDKHKFNKIKTWASCLPDEVRDKDYEMDMFAVPRKIKKVPSPIKHLLKEDQKEDEIPTPQWGHKDAPPLVGGVRKGPRDENQSPPPEPTPPPPTPPPPAPVRAPSSSIVNSYQPRPSLSTTSTSNQNLQQQIPRPTPSLTPQLPSYQNSASPIPAFPRQQPFQQQTPTQSFQSPAPQTPVQQHRPQYMSQQLHQTPYASTQTQGYGSATPGQNYGRPQTQQSQIPGYPNQQQHLAQEHRSTEAFVLTEMANEAIPKDIRDRFPQDDQGRILFFTTPPLDTRHVVLSGSKSDARKPLTHSDKYLEAKAAREKLIIERKRKAHDELDTRANGSEVKRLKPGFFRETRDGDGRISSDPTKATQLQREFEVSKLADASKDEAHATELRSRAMRMLSDGIVNATVKEYLQKYGDKAVEVFDQDRARTALKSPSENDSGMDEATLQPVKDDRNLLSQDFWTGRFPDGSGRFEDDYDNRLPR